MLSFYRELIHLRKGIPSLSSLTKAGLEVSSLEETIVMKRRYGRRETIAAMNFGKANSEISLKGIMTKDGVWMRLLDSSDREWLGTGPISPDELYCQNEFEIKPLSFVLYERNRQ